MLIATLWHSVVLGITNYLHKPQQFAHNFINLSERQNCPSCCHHERNSFKQRERGIATKTKESVPTHSCGSFPCGCWLTMEQLDIQPSRRKATTKFPPQRTTPATPQAKQTKTANSLFSSGFDFQPNNFMEHSFTYGRLSIRNPV